jgi:hypothetical protein
LAREREARFKDNNCDSNGAHTNTQKTKKCPQIHKREKREKREGIRYKREGGG